MEALYLLTDQQQRSGATSISGLSLDQLLPYISLLVVPTLGRMSTDANADIRQVATATFATLVKLMPLAGGSESEPSGKVGGSLPSPPNLPKSLLARWEEEKHFLGQLLNAKKADNYPLKVDVRLVICYEDLIVQDLISD